MGEGEHGPQGWGLGVVEIWGGLEGPSRFSCSECSGAPQGARFPEGWQAESGGGAQVSPIPWAWCQAPGEGSPHPAADLGLGLSPRRPTGPICWLYGQLCGLT